MEYDVREPKQQRAILKKESIIDAGFKCICEVGYHNTNTAEIAKEANFSTGIIYQYFKDKHDILIAGLEKYGEDIFFPIIRIEKVDLKKDFENTMKSMIKEYINNHKISKVAHEEITAMVHSDSDVAEYFYKKELESTDRVTKYLLNNGFKDNNLQEKVHISMGLIDNLCHEVIYHKHKKMDYDKMTDLVVDLIIGLFKNDI